MININSLVSDFYVQPKEDDEVRMGKLILFVSYISFYIHTFTLFMDDLCNSIFTSYLFKGCLNFFFF